MFHTSWTGENSLIGLYDEDDLRLQAYFQRRYNKSGSTRNPTYYAGQYHPHKYDQRAGTNYSSQAWRTPELYLNLAEAYAQKASGVSNDAIGLLNQLRVKKYKSGSPNAEKQISDFATKDDLIQFIWQERRRELCFEEIMRFWDMRRQGMPSVEHRLFSSPKEYSVYRLKAEVRTMYFLFPKMRLVITMQLRTTSGKLSLLLPWEHLNNTTIKKVPL